MPRSAGQGLGEDGLGNFIETGGKVCETGLGSALVFNGNYVAASPALSSFACDSIGAGLARAQMEATKRWMVV